MQVDSKGKVTLPSSQNIDRSELKLSGKGVKELSTKKDAKYAKVIKTTYRNFDVAVKIPHQPRLTPAILNEIEILSSICHPNLCYLYGVSYEPSDRKAPLAICMELVSGWNLRELLEGKREMTLYKRVEFALQIARGLSWLHEADPPILHSDLKPENIMFDERSSLIKLVDFGFADFVPANSKKKALGGSPLYAAPEKLQMLSQASTAMDVYSWALVTWELIELDDIFEHVQSIPELLNMLNDGVRPQMTPRLWPIKLKRIVKQCWATDPEDRPTLKSILPDLEDIVAQLQRKQLVSELFGAHQQPTLPASSSAATRSASTSSSAQTTRRRRQRSASYNRNRSNNVDDEPSLQELGVWWVSHFGNATSVAWSQFIETGSPSFPAHALNTLEFTKRFARTSTVAASDMTPLDRFKSPPLPEPISLDRFLEASMVDYRDDSNDASYAATSSAASLQVNEQTTKVNEQTTQTTEALQLNIALHLFYELLTISQGNCPSEDPLVTIPGLLKMHRLFGPLNFVSQQQTQEMLMRVFHIFETGCFHFWRERIDSDALLCATKRPSSYLLRFRQTSNVDGFALSLLTTMETTYHLEIDWVVEQKQFRAINKSGDAIMAPTMPQLIKKVFPSVPLIPIVSNDFYHFKNYLEEWREREQSDEQASPMRLLEQQPIIHSPSPQKAGQTPMHQLFVNKLSKLSPKRLLSSPPFGE